MDDAAAGWVTAGAADDDDAASGAVAMGDALGVGAVAAGAHALRTITSMAKRFTRLSTVVAAYWFKTSDRTVVRSAPADGSSYPMT